MEVTINDFVVIVGLNRVSLQLPTETYKEMENYCCFGMQSDKIFARRLQSSSWTDIISSVYLCQYTSSWSDLEFHSTCFCSVSCNCIIQTNGLISELYRASVKSYWKLSVPMNCSGLHFLKMD